MTRNLFEHQAPPGVSIVQSFGHATGFNGHPHWFTNFTAVCTCGARSSVRQLRSDALDELEGHACGAADAGAAS